ncbi:MAG TPA: hypothetical protein VF322_17530 [Gammaproteobacteria bacterium]
MRFRALTFAATLSLLLSSAARSEVQVVFVPFSPADARDAAAYRAIWDAYGERIVASLEARTCLRFPEAAVPALVAEDVSHSGGPEHPMRLRSSYGWDAKKSTLVHELGHRHLWQLAERLDDVDGHQTLFLFLDRVWADVWGEAFAERRIRGESEWQASYDYGTAWAWARSLGADGRARLWNRLLAVNGFPSGCDGTPEPLLEAARRAPRSQDAQRITAPRAASP